MCQFLKIANIDYESDLKLKMVHKVGKEIMLDIKYEPD